MAMSNANDLVGAIAKRVEELADKRMRELRSINGYGCSTEYEAQQKDRGLTRGQVVASIILEEFYSDDRSVRRSCRWRTWRRGRL